MLQVTDPVEVEPSSMTVVDVTPFHEFDIGRYIGQATTTSNDLKYKLLTECWTPSESYVFPRCDGRVFRSAWLKVYSPWLAYSKMLEGPLCRYCVLFPQVVKRGKQGAFILYPSKKYSQFTCEADDHVRNVWHKGSLEDATNFIALRNRKALPN